MKAAEAGFVVARRQLSDTNVKSPIAGVVTARPVNVGTRVKVGDVIANVVQIARLKTRIQVAERDVFKIAVGDVVTMTTDVYPDKIIAGTIATISDKSDAAHTFSVEVEFANPADAPLKAGMFARVHLDTKQTAALPAIPRAALTGSLRDPHVYVIENGIAKLRHVVVDDEVDGWLAVRSGLANGDAVVVSGQSNLRNDVAVTTAQ
jgi:RND family efflux transporter MFP subunit